MSRPANTLRQQKWNDHTQHQEDAADKGQNYPGNCPLETTTKQPTQLITVQQEERGHLTSVEGVRSEDDNVKALP